jgi:hypothetical protein
VLGFWTNFTKDPMLSIINIDQTGTASTPEGFSYDYTGFITWRNQKFQMLFFKYQYGL